MNKAVIILCAHLGVWGFFGFLMTLILGVFASYAHLNESVFYGFLIAFAMIGIIESSICVYKECKK
jgi:hypothetical protein